MKNKLSKGREEKLIQRRTTLPCRWVKIEMQDRWRLSSKDHQKGGKETRLVSGLNHEKRKGEGIHATQTQSRAKRRISAPPGNLKKKRVEGAPANLRENKELPSW